MAESAAAGAAAERAPPPGRILRPAALLERLQQEAASRLSSLALAVIDIENFHSVNQAHGFAAGDRFLAAVGTRLARRLRADDKLTRLGGDEFAALLFDVFDAPSAVAAVRDLLAGLDDPFTFNAGQRRTSARAGVALCPSQGRDVRALLYAARAALARAKATGTDVAAAQFDGHADLRAAAGATADSRRHDTPTGREIRDGLLRGEFKIHYQPIHDCDTGRVETLEALVRWRHPTRGMIGPASFLPAAERAGLAHALSVRVLDCACDSLRRWRARGHEHMRVAVNLSAQDFRRDDFAGTVAAALERHRLPPSSLELELTEHEQFEDEDTIGQVAELARQGVALTIDDFGVKYSSLRYLHRLPVRALKVDRSFVHDVGHSKASTSIVSAIVGIASQMGLRLVAEGVEQVRQRDELRRLGCHVMQGYLFSPPVPADDVAGYLARTAAH
jgi:diguanylate cyclase (GGDEF)-like protein